MNSILVKDHMDGNPHAIHQDETVRSAVQKLNKAQIIGAPVVDDNHRLVGFVSEQDCLREVLNEAFYYQDSPAVRSVMSTNVTTVAPDKSVVEIAEAMQKGPPKYYPVVDNGKLVGLISRRIVLKALLESNRGSWEKK